jgi:hypothetical protein
VSALETSQRRHRELRYVVVSVIVLALLLLVQIAAGFVREAVSSEPSALERVETCLVERRRPFEPVEGDPVASSAERGALRVDVFGNHVTVALGGSERDAKRVYDAYVSVAPSGAVGTTLDLHRRVVFLWDTAPTAEQRDFMYLCTLDVQD